MSGGGEVAIARHEGVEVLRSKAEYLQVYGADSLELHHTVRSQLEGDCEGRSSDCGRGKYRGSDAVGLSYVGKLIPVHG